jgi:phage terminase large subunit
VTTLRIETPRVFLPLLATEPRYFGARGGRGSGKSHFFCEQAIEEALYEHIRCACLREVQNSIKDSVKQLLEDKIRKLGVESLFKVTENEITGPNDSLFVFKGLRNHTVSSIKSLEGFNRAFVEEAQTISQKSLDIAIPTFRVPGAKLRFGWNPDKPSDPIETFFKDNEGDPDFVLVHANYSDNPWFAGSALQNDMERDKRNDPEKYAHVWLGAYAGRTEAKVFRNYRIQDFTSPVDAVFRFGGDWGFSIDPTVLIRAFIGRWDGEKAIADPNGRCLFIDHEAYSVGCEIDQTPALFDTVPRSRDFRITADSARPETVSYMRRNGFPKIVPAIKGPGSIEDGISFLQSFEIIIHPRCVHAAREFAEFSYKIDKQTDEILPFLDDKDNHVIDSARYALEGLRRAGVAPKPEVRDTSKPKDRYFRERESQDDGGFYG